MNYLIKVNNKRKKQIAHLWSEEEKDTICRMYTTGGITSKNAYKINEFKGDASICQICTNNLRRNSKRLKFKGNMNKNNIFSNYIREEFEKEVVAKKKE